MVGLRWFSRWVLGITLLFLVCSLVVIWQLRDIHQQLNHRDGENTLWALTQAQNNGMQLARDWERFQAGTLSAEAFSLQEDVFFSRLNMLRDGPQQRALEHYGENQPIQRAIASFEQSVPESMARVEQGPQALAPLDALVQQFRDSGNNVMVREREDRSVQIDHLGGLIGAALTALTLMVLAGAVLVWQLKRSLARRREQMHTIGQQRDALQQTVLDLQRARDATETYRNFVSLVSHQFRTPLAVIDSTAQRLVRSSRKSGDMPLDLLEQKMGLTRDTVEGLTRLLDSVLTSVRLEGGGIQLQAITVNLCDVVHELVERNAAMLEGRTVALQIDGEPGDYLCMGDASLLEHVLQNLVANTCKYTDAGSPLAISLTRQADVLTCTVRDWGPGVSAEELPFLFDRFFRSVRVHRTKGSGLGLHLARAIAQLHKGDIEASLPEGGGLAMCLHLPALPPVKRAARAEAQALAA